jgi:hypothetical protein
VHREHPHTIALHDVLYGALVSLREGEPADDIGAIPDALARVAGLEHPLRSQLRELTGQREVAPDRSLDAILAAEPSVPLRDDPLEALELHLRQRRELVHLLEQRQEELVRNLQRTSRMLDLSVGAAAVLFILAGIGWAVAFDWFSVVDEPVIEDRQQDEKEPERTPAGRSDRSE